MAEKPRVCPGYGTGTSYADTELEVQNWFWQIDGASCMKRLEAILSRDSLNTVTGVLMAHGCGEILLFRLDGTKGSELASPDPSVYANGDSSWIGLEAVVVDAEALPALHAILGASHGQCHGSPVDDTEQVSSIAIWNVEPGRQAAVSR
jgi:hypothetical protein